MCPAWSKMSQWQSLIFTVQSSLLRSVLISPLSPNLITPLSASVIHRKQASYLGWDSIIKETVMSCPETENKVCCFLFLKNVNLQNCLNKLLLILYMRCLGGECSFIILCWGYITGFIWNVHWLYCSQSSHVSLSY